MKKSIAAVKNRIKDIRAFTMAEALVAVTILLLVTAIVAGGIPAATRAYDNVVVASNAEVLLSTSMTELRNALATGKDFRISEEKTISFYNEAYGSFSTISLAGNDTDKPGNILYDRYGTDPLLKDVYTDSGLVSEMASTDKMYATYKSIEGPQDGVITVSGLQILRKGSGKTVTPATGKRTLYIRVINDSNGQNNP